MTISQMEIVSYYHSPFKYDYSAIKMIYSICNRKFYKKVAVGIAIITALFISCTNEEQQIVARFGNHTISLLEFRTAYLERLKQSQTFDSIELRESFLNEMINRKLLAEQAHKLKLDRDELFKRKVEAYHNKCLREAHYRHVIEPKAKINEPLLKETFQYTKEQRRIKHLFFPSKAQADSAYQFLQQGTDFDELAKVVFIDNHLASSGGDLGWVDWDQLEYDMAMQAFRQKLNTISPPIRSSHGYHILKIIDWKREVFISQDDYQLHRDKHSHLLKQKIGDQIAYQYIDQMMNGLDIQVRTRELEMVGKQLSQLISQAQHDSNQLNPERLSSDEIKFIETTLWDIRERPLFIINGQTFTVGQFIANLPYLPRNIVRKSYKTALDYSIRDFQLTKEAKQMGLDKKLSTVGIKSKLFEEYLLQMKLRKKIIDSITVTEKEIEKKYDELTASKKNTRPYTEFRTELKNIILRDKKASEVPRYINQLTQGLPIEKNIELIHQYYDSITRN